MQFDLAFKAFQANTKELLMATNNLWFKNGLRFQCIWDKCFACCTGSPGYVWLVCDEAEKIADFLNITLKNFLVRYTIKHANRISLKEKKSSLKSYYDCIFLDRTKGCKIYPVRPAQCISYPFWREILKSKKAWDEEANFCPGINRGTLKTQTEILKLMSGKLPPIS